MEFLVIGESKLKIIMSVSDVKKYGIDSLNSDCTDPLCRRAVWSVLDVARDEVGFDPSGDKILVQFYPINGGGCEVFVTKLGILSASSAKIVSRSDKVALLSRVRLLYCFDGIEPLVLAAKAIIKNTKSPPLSDVYVGQKDKYFLLIEEYGKGGEISEFPYITEFGRSLPADFLVYVLEHAEPVYKGDGVEKLSKL